MGMQEHRRLRRGSDQRHGLWSVRRRGRLGTLLGMPASEGLFRRAIMQSGTAERFRTAEESALVTEEFLRHCGLDGTRAAELLSLPTSRLLAAQKAMTHAAAERTFAVVALPFQPTVGTPSLPHRPLDAVRRGLNASVDLLVGTNLNEGSLALEMRPSYPSDPQRIEDRLENQMAGYFGDADTARLDYKSAVAFCLGAEPTGTELLEACISDQLYRQPSNRLLDARSGASGSTFSYLFTWPSPAMEGRYGACHALEIPFVFRQLNSGEGQSLLGECAPSELSTLMSTA